MTQWENAQEYVAELIKYRQSLLIRRQSVLHSADTVQQYVRNARTFDELKSLLLAHCTVERHVAQALHQEAEDIEARITAAAAASRKQTKG